MSSLKFIFIILCFAGELVFAAPIVTTAGTAHMTTKSFTEWKSEKIQLAKEKLAKTKTVSDKKEVNEQEFNLEVAEGLSITDYIVLYLSSQPGNSKFKEAATHLSPDETAKILEAYLKALQAQQEEEKQMSLRSSAVDLLN